MADRNCYHAMYDENGINLQCTLPKRVGQSCNAKSYETCKYVSDEERNMRSQRLEKKISIGEDEI